MKLYYPWDAKMKIQQNIKAQIWGDLYNQSSRFLRYRDSINIPDKKVITMVEDVYQQVENKKWVIVACDSMKILQSFSEVFQMAYSFTSTKYSIQVDTAKLISILNDKGQIDDYLQQKFTNKEKLVLYPLLLWDGILFEHKWGKGYRGNIASVFQERVRCGHILVTTVHYPGDISSAFTDKFFTSLADVWGTGIKNIIYEMSVCMIYRILDKSEFTCFNRDL